MPRLRTECAKHKSDRFNKMPKGGLLDRITERLQLRLNDAGLIDPSRSATLSPPADAGLNHQTQPKPFRARPASRGLLSRLCEWSQPGGQSRDGTGEE